MKRSLPKLNGKTGKLNLTERSYINTVLVGKRLILNSIFMFRKPILFLTFLIFTSFPLTAQVIDFNGDVRYAVVGNGADESGLDNLIGALRTRAGASVVYDENHSFHSRLAVTVSDSFEQLRFTIQADGGGLNLGSISFDQFYYSYKNESTELRIGRYQQSLPILSNSTRSHIRFQSNLVNNHFSDGVYWKQNLDNGWYSEVIAEYQPRNHTTYPYRNNLNFGGNEHNFTTYAGLENRERDEFNIIQKAAGFFIAPDAYFKNGEYTTYTAFSSRIAVDLPQGDALKGGSIRLAGELGQNLSTSFDTGTIAVFSAGINGYDEKHQLMAEFAKIDQQWLLASVFVQNTDELELRYRFFATDQLYFDARYRIRSSRIDGINNSYSTFIRVNYSF